MHHFQATQQLRLKVQNEALPIAHYLRQPQRLVQAVTDVSRIQPLSETVFRLKLRPLDFMMLRFQPIADLEVKTQEDGTLQLRMLRAELKGAEFLQESTLVNLEGELTPYPRGAETELIGHTQLDIQVELPAALKLVPKSVLESAGTTFLNGLLLSIKNRIKRHLVQDYRQWAIATPAGSAFKKHMPLENPTS